MRRRLLLTIPAFLLLGALANIGVAWSVAIWALPSGGVNRDLETKSWPAPAPSDWPAPHMVMRSERLGRSHIFAYDLGADEDTRDRAQHTIDARLFGMPMRSMMYATLDDTKQAGQNQSWFAAWPVPQRLRARAINNYDAWALPAAIIPTGFAVNTAFFAALLWLFAFMPFWLRRFLRRRRNLCPACAYPIGASPICTECGATLHAPKGL